MVDAEADIGTLVGAWKKNSADTTTFTIMITVICNVCCFSYIDTQNGHLRYVLTHLCDRLANILVRRPLTHLTPLYALAFYFKNWFYLLYTKTERMAFRNGGVHKQTMSRD